MYLCWSFNSTKTLFHILHSVYVSSEFPTVLVLTSPLQLCFLNNTSRVQTQAPNSLSWKRVFASLCNTRLPGAFCSDKATLLGACVLFCTVMVFLLATATGGLEMQHRQTDRQTACSFHWGTGRRGSAERMTQKTSKKYIQASHKICTPVFQSL